MRILHVARRDLLETLRDPLSLLFLVAMPVAFTLFFGLVFRNTQETQLYQVTFENQDAGSPVALAFERAIRDTGSLDLVPLDGTERQAIDAVRAGRRDGVLIIPAGWGERALAGDISGPRLIVDEAEADGRAVTSALRAASSRMESLVAIARTALRVWESEGGQPAGEKRQALVTDVLAAAAEAYRQPAVQVEMSASGARASAAPSGYQQSSPGMLAQFAVFGIIGPAALVVAERRSGTLARLLTTSVSRAQVAAGHMLAIMATVLLSQCLMVVVGQAFLGVGYLSAPWACLLMLLATSFFSGSLGMLLAALLKAEEQLSIWVIILGLTMSALGGAWFSLEVTGETFSRIGHLSPLAWAVDGLQNIVVRGLGTASVLLPAGVLVGYGAVLLALAAWRLRAR